MHVVDRASSHRQALHPVPDPHSLMPGPECGVLGGVEPCSRGLQGLRVLTGAQLSMCLYVVGVHACVPLETGSMGPFGNSGGCRPLASGRHQTWSPADQFACPQDPRAGRQLLGAQGDCRAWGAWPRAQGP